MRIGGVCLMRHKYPEQINVRMETEMKDALEELSKDNEVSVAWLVRQAIKEYLEKFSEDE